MGINSGPDIVEDGLVLCLDAGNRRSYPGTGTGWFDLSGNGYDFNVSASAYSTSDGIDHMNFEGSFGIAKRIVGGSLTDMPTFANATICVFSEVITPTNWRTMLRGAANDHQVIIQSGTNDLGMYDNDGGNFIDSTFNIDSIPNYDTKFNYMCWRLSQSSPYYQFQYNNDTTVYSITNVNSTFNNGFCCIGGFHEFNAITTSASQYWGKMAYFSYYNRHLSSEEISQNFNALRGRFGI
jgi:hypothetical protein